MNNADEYNRGQDDGHVNGLQTAYKIIFNLQQTCAPDKREILAYLLTTIDKEITKGVKGNMGKRLILP